MFEKIKNFFKNLKKEFNDELRKLEEDQNKHFNEKIEKFNESLDKVFENQELYKEIIESREELKHLKEKVKKREDLIKEIKIPEIDKDKFILFYSDDHPGALFQIFNDIRVILEKRTHIVDINEELIEKIQSLQISPQFFNLIPFKTEDAPFYMQFFIENNIIPDIAILDIVFGGIVLIDQQFFALDGIDIGKMILDKNPKSVVLFYTGCNLSEYSREGKKLKNLLNDEVYKDRVFVVDKDINDNNRIEAFYKAFSKLLELNPEKHSKLKDLLCRNS